MKAKPIFICAFCTLILLSPFSDTKAQIPVLDVLKTLAKKVIKAIDLEVQRLQNNTIDLQNIQKQIENALSKLKLDEIADWTNKQKQLYQDYFDELWRVKSIIAYYKRITEIIEKQKQLVSEYKQAYAMVQQDSHFSKDELNYIYTVYTGIINESLKSVDEILTLIQSFTVQMSDAQRLELLNHSADEIEQRISDLRQFKNENIQISLQRAKDLNDINAVRQLYGLSN